MLVCYNATCLYQANFAKAILDGADLLRVDAREASLILASLEYAHLDQADLREANLQGPAYAAPGWTVLTCGTHG